MDSAFHDRCQSFSTPRQFPWTSTSAPNNMKEHSRCVIWVRRSWNWVLAFGSVYNSKFFVTLVEVRFRNDFQIRYLWLSDTTCRTWSLELYEYNWSVDFPYGTSLCRIDSRNGMYSVCSRYQAGKLKLRCPRSGSIFSLIRSRGHPVAAY